MNNIYLTPDKSFTLVAGKQQAVGGEFLYELIAEWQKQEEYKNRTDFTVEINSVRYRVHLFRSYRGLNASLRRLPSEIMSFDELTIKPDDVENCISDSGLTLFCGQASSGKSTTMNTAINYLLNKNKLGVTITVENPIEYLHNEDIIFQKEVGTHTPDFDSGLIDAMRESPKTIVIGEIRSAEVAKHAIIAGLNGHRVLATFHAGSVADVITRMWAMLDDQGDEILIQALSGIFVQELISDNDNNQYCFYESLAIDFNAKLTLTQILDKNNQTNMSALNHLFYDQKQKTILQKKDIR